jgi:hypothetical protein
LHPLGTGAYFVFPCVAADPAALCVVMQNYRECAFLVFDGRHTFADGLPPNAMRLIPFQELRDGIPPRKGSLFGAFSVYDGVSFERDASRKRLEALSGFGCMFYVLTAAPGASSRVQAQVARKTTELRQNLSCPVFPVSLETDVQYVDAPVTMFLPQFAGAL